VSLVLILCQRLVPLDQAIAAWVEGVKDVLEPTIILCLAWTLGLVIQLTHVGPLLARALGSSIPGPLFPTIVMIIGYLMSYGTGTSFGTMGILFPLVVPLVVSLTDDSELRLQSVSAILGGSVFGNVVSPIADTSVLTALATKCDLNNHISTSTPYVAVVAVAAVLLGTLPCGFKVLDGYVATLLQIVFVVCFLLFAGSPASAPEASGLRWCLAKAKTLRKTLANKFSSNRDLSVNSNSFEA